MKPLAVRLLTLLGTAFIVGVVGFVGIAQAQEPVTPGAFCSPAGATGVTSTGLPMVCGMTAQDMERNRWRDPAEVQSQAAPATVPPLPATVPSQNEAPPGELAETGVESVYLAGVALGLIVVGFALRVVGSDLAFRSNVRRMRSVPVSGPTAGW